jgi:ABC-type antimicrobial peptide transport system permease subunit
MFGITESDPATYAFAAVLFVALGFTAGLAPARSAARVDPVTALRAE